MLAFRRRVRFRGCFESGASTTLESAYREAQELAYADAFLLIMVAFAIAVVLVPLMRKATPSPAVAAREH